MTLEIVVGASGLIIATCAATIAYLQLRRMPRASGRSLVRAGVVHDQGHRLVVRPMHNLPAREEFIGRVAEQRRLIEGLASPYPVSLEGLGGMGKTALAREVAWLVADRPALHSGQRLPTFDVIVWTENRGGRLELNDVLDTIAEVVGRPYVLSLPGPEKLKAIVGELRDIACLLIVDDLEAVTDPGLLEFLQHPPSKVVVTGRTHRLPNAWVVSLGKLDQTDGLSLIKSEARRLGYEHLTHVSESTLLDIYDATGGNPLAIRLAAGQLKAEGTSIKEVVSRLERADSDIFDLLFGRSWNTILRYDEYARRVLMALSLFSGSASREGLEAGSDVHGLYFRSAMTRLTSLSLVDVTDPQSAAGSRYQLHTLTRAFVRRQLDVVPDTLNELTGRLIDFFLGFATAHADTYVDLRHVQAFNVERTNILEFADTAYQEACDRSSELRWWQVIQFSDAMSAYLWGRGFWDDRIRLCERASKAAEALGDNEAGARQAVLAGRVRLWLKDLAGAKEYLARSQALVGGAASDAAKSVVKRLRAQVASAEGDYPLAETLLTEILKVAPASTDDEGQAATLLELGVVAERQGRLFDARDRYERALRLDEGLATVEGQAVSTSHLGKVLLEIGDVEAAQAAFSRGLVLARQANRLNALGQCELGLARLFADRGERQKAIEYARSAEGTFVRLGTTEMADEARTVARAAMGAR